MKIILDFDDMIFNTHQLAQESVKVFEKFSFAEKEFWNAYQKCKEKMGDFDLDTVIDLIFNSNKLDHLSVKSCLSDKKKIKEEMNSLFCRAGDFVYPDFFDFINNFNKKDLILLSFGTIDFQGMKIKNSGIIPYFQEVIITGKDKSDDLKNILIKNKNEKIFFIDDKAEQIDNVKEKLSQIIAMKMERSQGGHINTESKLADYVVKDLNEVRNIINNLNK
jgi:FMN phosphatase YigB (HAD superfamily)